MAHDDNEEVPSFSTIEEEVKYWKSKVTDLHDTLNETESTLQDFMESSKELEAEMEREISASNRRLGDLQSKNEAMRTDVDNWKGKYQSSLAEHNKALAELNKELEVLRESHNLYKTRVRDMELTNDELESAERMVQSSLVDMEGRYNKAIERTALLEEELVTKAMLEEENQRLKDEIRELNEELAFVRNVTPALSRTASRADDPTTASVGADHVAASMEADLNLSDLVMNRPMSSASSASVGQQSAGSAAARAMSPDTTLTTTTTTTKSRPPISGQSARLGHSRRGSRDLQTVTLPDPSAASGSGARHSMSTSVRPIQSTRLSRPSGASGLSARRSGVPGPGTVASGVPTSSSTGYQRTLQDMMARMKSLETRLNSARNMSRLPTSTLASSTSSRYGLSDAPSAIPRPSSRLGNSQGPGAGNANFTPRASASLSRRDSVDGRPSASAIPVPSGGLARSTLGPRPSSRLSSAGRDTPPLPNSGGAVSPSEEYGHGAGQAAAQSLNRKRSGTGGAYLGVRPRGSGGSALPLPSGSAAAIALGKSSSAASSVARPSIGLTDRRDGSESDRYRSGPSPVGPPSSWMTRIGAVPGQTRGESGSSGSSGATVVGVSARPRSSSGTRPATGTRR
ncbi:hypothetical protein V8E36_003700 [Tilletia maclaganii]